MSNLFKFLLQLLYKAIYWPHIAASSFPVPMMEMLERSQKLVSKGKLVLETIQSDFHIYMFQEVANSYETCLLSAWLSIVLMRTFVEILVFHMITNRIKIQTCMGPLIVEVYRRHNASFVIISNMELYKLCNKEPAV